MKCLHAVVRVVRGVVGMLAVLSAWQIVRIGRTFGVDGKPE